MVHQFGSDTSNPNPSAILEQAAMLCAIGWNRRDQAVAIINAVGGGEILRWSFTPTTFPPSYIVWRQGLDVFVNIFGTVNTRQAIGDVLGYLGTRYELERTETNAFFNFMWGQIALDIVPLINGIGPGTRYHWSGHSYGAACALLGSLNSTEFWRRGNVQYMGFGCPKVFTTGLQASIPSPTYNITTVDDIIPQLPNPVMNFVVSAGTNNILSSPLNWTHVGRMFQITDAGETRMIDGGSLTWNAVGDLTNFNLDNHVMQKYGEVAIAQFNRAGG